MAVAFAFDHAVHGWVCPQINGLLRIVNADRYADIPANRSRRTGDGYASTVAEEHNDEPAEVGVIYGKKNWMELRGDLGQRHVS